MTSTAPIRSASLRHVAAARPWARAAVCLTGLGLLSACAGGQRISASQEASHYEEEARSSYNAPGPHGDPWGPYIRDAASRYDVPERWIREVMRVESGGRTEQDGRPITSGAGAMGLMQVMPTTYDELRRRYSLGDDPYDPHNSILAGAAYIRELYDLYGSPGFLAAYNAGPGRLDDYLTRNRVLPAETRRYVAMIGPRIAGSFPSKRSTSETYAMNDIPTSIPAGPRYAAPAPASAQPALARSVPPALDTAPVEVAEAPPSASDAAFDPPPGWTPTNMSRQEIAAYVPPPGEPPAPLPAPALPGIVADIPSNYEPAPMPSSRATEAAVPRYEPPVQHLAMVSLPVPPPPAQRAAPQQFASLPLPPVQAPAQSIATDFAPGSRRGNGLRLFPAANAAPVNAYRGSPGHWAIQVGAYGNEGQANSAVGMAREQAGASVSGARPVVGSVHESRGVLYRARLTGLSREAATQACERLRGHGPCIVLSPDAQS